MKIQITISDLKNLIHEAKKMKSYDSSLGQTIEFTKVKDCDTHEGSDLFKADLKSGYAECNSKSINH